jgi:hypothetical protein
MSHGLRGPVIPSLIRRCRPGALTRRFAVTGGGIPNVDSDACPISAPCPPRRCAHERALPNPNGITSQSVVSRFFPQPQRGCIHRSCTGGFNPVGVVFHFDGLPRVASWTRQPWAKCRYPVGVIISPESHARQIFVGLRHLGAQRVLFSFNASALASSWRRVCTAK